MRGDRITQKAGFYLNKKRVIVRLALIYLLIFTASLLVAPTNAHYTHKEIIIGKISVPGQTEQPDESDHEMEGRKADSKTEINETGEKEDNQPKSSETDEQAEEKENIAETKETEETEATEATEENIDNHDDGPDEERAVESQPEAKQSDAPVQPDNGDGTEEQTIIENAP